MNEQTESCVLCSNTIGDSGVYYLDRRHVCKTCYQSAEPIEPESPKAGGLAIAACLAMAIVAAVVSWVLS